MSTTVDKAIDRMAGGEDARSVTRNCAATLTRMAGSGTDNFRPYVFLFNTAVSRRRA